MLEKIKKMFMADKTIFVIINIEQKEIKSDIEQKEIKSDKSDIEHIKSKGKTNLLFVRKLKRDCPTFLSDDELSKRSLNFLCNVYESANRVGVKIKRRRTTGGYNWWRVN